MKLYEAMKVWEIALFMIKNKGYKIGKEMDMESGEWLGFTAIKDKNKYFGHTPISLLGIINIAEEYGENWKKIETGNLYGSILKIENKTEFI